MQLISRAENPFQESLDTDFFPVYKSFHVLFVDMTLIDTCIVCAGNISDNMN